MGKLFLQQNLSGCGKVERESELERKNEKPQKPQVTLL